MSRVVFRVPSRNPNRAERVEPCVFWEPRWPTEVGHANDVTRGMTRVKTRNASDSPTRRACPTARQLAGEKLMTLDLFLVKLETD